MFIDLVALVLVVSLVMHHVCVYVISHGLFCSLLHAASFPLVTVMFFVIVSYVHYLCCAWGVGGCYLCVI